MLPAFCAVSSALATAAPPSFATQQVLSVGYGPASAAVADINADGKIDLIIANQSDNTVSVLLNTTAAGAAQASFAAQATFATQSLTTSIAIADINADGKPDLVVANYSGNSISILLNTTAPGASVPSFAVQQAFAAGLSPHSVVVADFNGDGKPDVATANLTSGTFSVFLNTTMPGAQLVGFTPQQAFAAGPDPYSIASADVNGDGKPDLIVANQGGNSVSVFLNTTAPHAVSATFAVAQSFAAGALPYSVAAADLNDDGKPDLVVANEFDNTTSVLINTTAPGSAVASFAPQQAFAVGTDPYFVAVADINGDGKRDVLVATPGDNAVSVLANATPSGAAVASFSTQQAFPAGLRPYAVAAADINGDGRSDLIVANYLDATVSVLLNTTLKVDLDQHGLTGSWYNPATSGQGFEIEVYPDVAAPGQGQFFAGWFTYDATAVGSRRWYGLTGNVSKASPTAALQIFDVEGGNLDAPPSVGATGALGQATIQFSDCNSGSLVYRFTDGSNRSGTIPLSRLTPNVTCSPTGDNGSAASDYLLSGNWYNPDTSGQGFIFDFSPSINNVFAAWYTFAHTGQRIGGPLSQAWFTLQSAQFVPGMTSLDNIAIVETIGGLFDNPAAVTPQQVGTANIAFQSCAAMTLAYTFTGGENKGLSGTINLRRVGPAPLGCSLN